jgi:hypothetical protein
MEHVANDSHVLSGERGVEPLAKWHEWCNTGTSERVALFSCKAGGLGVKLIHYCISARALL